MKTFQDLVFQSKNNGLDGTQATMDFPNGYGVSVITGFGAYGGEQGLYELAVVKGGVLCYDTPVTSDVVGYLSAGKVTELMQQVQELPAPAPATARGKEYNYSL